MKEKQVLDKEKLLKVLESAYGNPKVYYVEDMNGLLDDSSPFINFVELGVLVIGESSDIVNGIYFYPKK